MVFIPTDLSFLNLPSFSVGVLVGGGGVLLILLIATRKARKAQASLLQSVLQDVGRHMAEAQQQASEGNYGEASESATKALKEFKGLKDEMTFTEIMDESEKEESA